MDNFWSSGLLLAGAVGNMVSVWNPALGTNQDIQPQESVNTLQWSANNKVLALGGNNGSVALYSAGHYLGSLPLDTMKPVDMDEVTCARFSKDSKLLHTGSNSSCIYTWDLKQQTEMAAFREHRSRITSLAVAQNDECLASASTDGTLLLHVPGAPKALAVLASRDTHAPTKRCLSFSPVEQGLLAAACDDSSVCLWSIRGGHSQQHIIPYKHADRVTGVALSYTNPSLLFSCGADRQLLALDWRMGTAVQQARLAAPLTSLALCDNELYLAAGAADGTVSVADVRKLSAPAAVLRAGQALPVAELHWQSTIRASRRSSQAHALKPAPPAAAGPGAPAPAAAPPSSARTSAGAPGLPPHPAQAAPKDLSRSEPPRTTPSTDRPPGSQPSSAPTGPPSTSTPTSSISFSHPGNPSTAAASAAQQPLAAGLGAGASSSSSSSAGTKPASLSGGQATRAVLQHTSESPEASGLSPSTPAPPAAATAASPAAARPSEPPSHTAIKQRLALDAPGSSSRPSQDAEALRLGGTSAAGIGVGLTASSPRPKPGGGAAGAGTPPSGPRINMLTEGVFKAYMDDALTGMREDVRNLHIEMLKQFHVQQMEMNMAMLNIAQGLQSRQDALDANMQALQKQLDGLMQGQQGQWL